MVARRATPVPAVMDTVPDACWTPFDRTIESSGARWIVRSGRRAQARAHEVDEVVAVEPALLGGGAPGEAGVKPPQRMAAALDVGVVRREHHDLGAGVLD